MMIPPSKNFPIKNSWTMIPLMPNAYLVCGLVDMPDGTLKVYIHSRPLGYFIIVEHPEDIEAMKRHWSQTAQCAGGECRIDAGKIDDSAIQREEIEEWHL